MKNTLYWLPRTLAILFIAFISMFALDVFGEPNWPVALFMHLIPSYFLVAITIIAWKHELLGGFLFLAAGLALLVFTHLGTFIIWMPAFIIGILFLIYNRRYQGKLK
jgi:hypothetical protein